MARPDETIQLACYLVWGIFGSFEPISSAFSNPVGNSKLEKIIFGCAKWLSAPTLSASCVRACLRFAEASRRVTLELCMNAFPSRSSHAGTVMTSVTACRGFGYDCVIRFADLVTQLYLAIVWITGL